MASLTTSAADEPVVSVPCPLCGCDCADEIWRHASGVTNGVCTRCGHVYLRRRFPADEIAASYADYGQQYPESFLLDQGNPLFDVARGRYAFLQNRLPAFPPATLLEVGSGYGHFLSLFQAPSHSIGIEPSAEQAAFAERKLGVRSVIRGDYESSEGQPPLRDREFGLVCSFHVLEHLVDPVGFVEFARRLLEPGGYLCLAVPDLHTLSPDLIELYFMTRCWHLQTFSRGTMTWLLQSHGFTVEAVEQEGATPMLRSSTIFLARRDASEQEAPRLRGLYEDSRGAALSFHSELERRLAAIRDAFSEWRDRGVRVVLYGGGIHTRALLSLTGMASDAIVGIVDDDPNKRHTVVSGVPVMPLEEARTKGIDIIVVSTLASEDDIIARLEDSGIAAEVAVKGVYRDLCCSNGEDRNA